MGVQPRETMPWYSNFCKECQAVILRIANLVRNVFWDINCVFVSVKNQMQRIKHLSSTKSLMEDFKQPHYDEEIHTSEGT